MTTDKALIVLQENSGEVPFDLSLPPLLKEQLKALIDGFAETFEDLKTTLQGKGKYDVIHLLTDNACTREGLLRALVAETLKGRVIDLVVLGHGHPEELLLKHAPHLTGRPEGTIRSLKTEAKEQGVKKLNLRMVYMCNCYGSSLNDDWLALGAEASVGSKELDMMPEPMTTFFIHHWLAGRPVGEAARSAYDATVPFYVPFYPPTAKITYKTVEVSYPCPSRTNLLKMCKQKVEIPAGVELSPHTNVVQTELVVGGDANLTF